MSFSAPPKNPNAKRCSTCYYAWGASTAQPICDYYLATKQRRGCEPGVKCIRYKKAKDGVHWSESERRRDTNELYKFVTKGKKDKQEKEEENA